ncbi:hypothetical protein B7494_g722 [Chlorociboria aeruginascens]|nr:hypothetical protein B7494_g722 [Chlorociboria aeruginascens]
MENNDAVEIHSQTSASSGMRACDNCRARKVGEKSIESINNRLEEIGQSLKRLEISGTTSPFSSITSRSIPVARKTPVESPGATTSPASTGLATFEGESSETATSLHAKRLFEKTIRNNYFQSQSQEMKDVLSNLQNTFAMQSDPSTFHDLRFPNQLDLDHEISVVNMPQMEVVLAMLRSFKGTVPRFFLDMPFINMSDLIELCQKVYFCAEDYTPALFALVNGGLYYLFIECISGKSDQQATEYREFAATCRANLETTLHNFRLGMAPCFESCAALFVGAIHSTDISKPSLCLRFTAAAVQMCQSLGYHRINPSNMTKDAEKKKQLFWMTYCLDKALSLRIGHTSWLQDSDISTSNPSLPTDPLSRPWHKMFMSWIDFAKIQGQIYEKLYTVTALSATKEERGQRAQDMLQPVYQRKHFEFATRSNDVIFHAALTVVLREIPPLPSDASLVFTDECVRAAHTFLELHQTTMALFKTAHDTWNTYLVWALFYNPISPFMVIFCHVVTTLDTTDLDNLRLFSESLKPVGMIYESAERLYSLTLAFYQVAEVYINETIQSRAVASTIGTQHSPQGREFYSGFGTTWQEQWPIPGIMNQEETFGANNDQIMAMEDWFAGDSYMMGVLDGNFGHQ